MFELLPEKEREILKSDYKKRRWSVFFILVFLLGVISLGSFLPTYLMIQFEKKHLSDRLEMVQKESEELIDPEMFSLMNETSKMIESLKPHADHVTIGQIVRLVVANKPEDVSITSLAINKDEKEKSLKVSLAGFAVNRNVLLNFSNDLEEEEFINDTNIPLSSLTSEKDLNFSLQLEGDLE
ncbi:MAG: hypothetical protein ACLFNN_02750 [Candidatus Paceibacterota bacterium]